MKHDPGHFNPLPPDLSALAAALDDLARREQAGSPAGLSDRVYFRTASTLRAGPRRSTLRVSIASGMRLAAVLTLTTIGAVGMWRQSNPAPIQASSLDALDDVLSHSSDSQWSPIASSTLAEMQSELDALESDLDSFWTYDSNWFNDTDEESM